MTQDGRLAYVETVDRNGNEVKLPVKYIPKRDGNDTPIRDEKGVVITEPALSTKDTVTFLKVTHTTIYNYIESFNQAYPNNPIKPYKPPVGKGVFYTLEDLQKLQDILPS